MNIGNAHLETIVRTLAFEYETIDESSASILTQWKWPIAFSIVPLIIAHEHYQYGKWPFARSQSFSIVTHHFVDTDSNLSNKQLESVQFTLLCFKLRATKAKFPHQIITCVLSIDIGVDTRAEISLKVARRAWENIFKQFAQIKFDSLHWRYFSCKISLPS